MFPMKCSTGAFAAFGVLACLVMAGGPSFAQPGAGLQNKMVDIEYVRPRSSQFRQIYDDLTKRKVLEELRQFLTPLKLPRKLVVKIDECGAPYREFKPGGPAVICYETVSQIVQIASKADPDLRETVIVGTFVQAVLHEVAHGVIDILQVPVWGRMNDAADRLAAFIMMNFGDDVARQTIIGTAVFFELSGRSWTGSEFADLRSPEAQRYFNYLCIAFGGAPKTFEFLTKAEGDKKAILPEDRARRCAGEYAQVHQAFNLRIMPYVDADLLVKIRAIPFVIRSK
jgi:hypothetical protein